MEKFFKNPRVQAGLALVAVVLLGWWLAKSPAQKNPEQEQKEEQKTQQTEQNKTETKTTISNPNAWEGTLKTSDDAQKGNLMLMTQDKKIYIKTNRDFSALLGKTVAVTYEGTAEAFRLGDIVEKVVQSDTGN